MDCPICKKRIIDDQSFCFPREYQYQKCHFKCVYSIKSEEEDDEDTIAKQRERIGGYTK